MRILRKVKEITSRLSHYSELDRTFIFPYSDNKIKKRDEIWTNLQKGILIEDKKILIPWETQFNQLDKYAEKRKDRGDRTEWYFGKRTILDGYESHIETKMWSYLPWKNPLTEISENIGVDSSGNNKFLELNEKITELLGEPTKVELEKFGAYDLGVIQWKKGKAQISLVGIEHFNCRYSIKIGLIKDANEEYFNKSIDDLKAQGLTEEELGK